MENNLNASFISSKFFENIISGKIRISTVISNNLIISFRDVRLLYVGSYLFGFRTAKEASDLKLYAHLFREILGFT